MPLESGDFVRLKNDRGPVMILGGPVGVTSIVTCYWFSNLGNQASESDFNKIQIHKSALKKVDKDGDDIA